MPELIPGIGTTITLDPNDDTIAINLAQAQNTIFPEGVAALDSGTATGGSALNLVDTSKSWTANEYVDKIAKIELTESGIYAYAIIASNTANTLIFDDEITFRGTITVESGMDYSIIESYILTEEDQPTFIQADLSSGSIGIILDTIEENSTINGLMNLIRVGAGIGPPNELPFIVRGTQRIGTEVKYAVLTYTSEGIYITPITTGPPYWIAVQVFGVDRYFTGYLDDSTTFANTSYENALTFDQLNVDFFKRLVATNVSGKAEIELNSLSTLVYEAYFRANITRVSGAGTAFIAIAKKDGLTGVETILTERQISGDFDNQVTTLSLTVSAPVQLLPQDKVYSVVRVTAGSISIDAGSEFQVGTI